MSCKCKTLKGLKCKNKPKQGSVYCSRHQKCAKQARSPLKNVGGGKVSKKTVAANKKAFAALKVALTKLPPGELKKVCDSNNKLKKICAKNAAIRRKLSPTY